jgi:2-pyrone-4,6-dicarboxylate lactonase
VRPADAEPATYCLSPLADVEPASFVVPPGACDTHSHVVAASGEYPMVGERNNTPPPATEQMYLAMLDATGMTYGVLVQITVYGTDNRYLLEVLRHNPTRLRGVAMVAFDISDRELEQMHEAGVRGVRMNVLYGGPVDVAGMSSLARRISELALAHAVPDRRTEPA